MDTKEPRLRIATLADRDTLLNLWEGLFDSDESHGAQWQTSAGEWFARTVADSAAARFPVIEAARGIVATAIGTLELGVPNPFCLRGRTVRLANVFTVPEHRGRGYGTRLVHDIIDWARSIDADRVDLSATREGQRVYERTGFTLTTAPRMKLMLWQTFVEHPWPMVKSLGDDRWRALRR